jgi:glycosyltransferase involved in cell wall biosynthesis
MPLRRIAYASPVNPAASGISDYSEELLPYLGQYADITLYHEDSLKPSHPAFRGRQPAITTRKLSQLARDHKQKPYDAIIYHIGNSPVHSQIWRTMQRVPGVLVLHEFILHHFLLQYYANTIGDIDQYRAIAEQRYGAEGARIANLMLHGRFTEAAFDFPFCEDILATADGLIAHSQYVLDQSLAIRPDLPSAHVPMGIPLPPLIDREYARARRGIAPDAYVLASFGHINPYKRIDATLRAVRALLPDYPTIRYVLVGSISPNYDLHAAIARAGLQNVVSVTGYVDSTAFQEYVAAADICINLRHPTAGETSASLLRLLAAARPVLVTATGSFTELPAGTAAQVDPDASEGDLIQAYCRLFFEKPNLPAALGAAARTYIASAHSLAGAAHGYMQFLSRRYGWAEPQPTRPPLWELPEPLAKKGQESEAAPQPLPSSHALERGAQQQDQRSNTAITGGNPHPQQRHASQSALALRVGEALGDLGISEQHTTLLGTVARALHEIQGSAVSSQQDEIQKP